MQVVKSFELYVFASRFFLVGMLMNNEEVMRHVREKDSKGLKDLYSRVFLSRRVMEFKSHSIIT